MDATPHPQRLGRYALYDRIAAGGMATVYFGKLVGSGGFSRIVAVKRLHPHLAEEKEFTAMLLDEAYLAGRIRHPNVVSTLDIVSADKELFVVMEYVHGETVGRLLKAAAEEKTPIPLDITMAIIVGVLNGLHAAHETGNEQGEPLQIVHRDVSPQNIVVGVDGIPRLLDFGVAKARNRLQTTQDGRVKGKIAYMSAEQLTNKGVDRRTDIYGVGVVLWELLTGTRMFGGADEATMHSILNAPPPKPSSIRRDLPAAIDAITMRALARNPSQRYDTARQMSLALEKASSVATTTALGEWVATIAEPQLAERARIMRAIDANGAARGPDELPELPSLADADVEGRLDQPGTTELLTATATAPAFAPLQRRRPWVYGLIGAAVVAVASVTLVAKTRADRSPPADVTLGSSSAVPQIAPAAVPSTAPSSPSASASAATSVVAARASADSQRPQVPRFRPGARAPKADCTPPYTIDEIGVRHYKSACAP